MRRLRRQVCLCLAANAREIQPTLLPLRQRSHTPHALWGSRGCLGAPGSRSCARRAGRRPHPRPPNSTLASALSLQPTQEPRFFTPKPENGRLCSREKREKRWSVTRHVHTSIQLDKSPRISVPETVLPGFVQELGRSEHLYDLAGAPLVVTGRSLLTRAALPPASPGRLAELLQTQTPLESSLAPSRCL